MPSLALRYGAAGITTACVIIQIVTTHLFEHTPILEQLIAAAAALGD